MKTPDTTKAASRASNRPKFRGTDNPRHLRAIAALLRRPMPRESIDREAGTTNGPELVAELCRRGLDVPCEYVRFIDRDGYTCRAGVYHLTTSDRRKLNQWIAQRKGETTNGQRPQ